MSEKNLKVEIGQLLKEAHLYPNVRGYVFLRDAIYAKLLNPTLNCAGCLKMVADEHGTNAKNVNSLMRHALRIIINNNGLAVLNKKFNVECFTSYDAIRVYMFICLVAEFVEEKIERSA